MVLERIKHCYVNQPKVCFGDTTGPLAVSLCGEPNFGRKFKAFAKNNFLALYMLYIDIFYCLFKHLQVYRLRFLSSYEYSRGI